jgi:hypothetical protein
MQIGTTLSRTAHFLKALTRFLILRSVGFPLGGRSGKEHFVFRRMKANNGPKFFD